MPFLDSPMSSLATPVSLADVLEVRGGALTENEAWGVLSQTSEAIQNLFIKELAFDKEGICFVISPDTVMLLQDGTINILESCDTSNNSSYMAPESQRDTPLSLNVVDKMYVYSMGRTLQSATRYNLTPSQVPKLSPNLENLFGAMCEVDPNHRLNLGHILEACALHAQKKTSRKSFSSYIIKLHAMAHGVASLNNSFGTYGSSYGSDVSGFTYSTERSRSRPLRESRKYQKKKSHRSRSRSRSSSHERNKDDRHSLYRRKSNPDRDSGIGTLREVDVQRRSKINVENLALHGATAQTFKPIGAELIHQAEPVNVAYATQLSTEQYLQGYNKYLQLKERQRRLKAVRNGGDDRPLSFRQPGVTEKPADLKSLYSLISNSAGAYMTEQPSHYGSEVTVKLGQSSESMLSSDVSMTADTTLLKSTKDTSTSTLPIPPARKRPQRIQPINKNFVGPEFIHNSTKPVIRLPMPLTGDSSKNPALARRVTIVHLTGQKYEVVLDPATNGRQLFDAVITHIGISEYYYFGLTYITDNEHFFIDPDTKLYKVAPDGWKEVIKGQLPVLSFTVYIRVKYYIDSITDIRHDDSYHLMYLQLRRDILEDRFQVTDEQAHALAGLALQVEFGDHYAATMSSGYFVVEQYFSNRLIRKAGRDVLYEHAMNMHMNLKGTPASQSELEFVKCIQKLPEYGIHYHKLQKNKTDNLTTVWVGVSSRCLSLAERQGHERVIIHQFPWQATQKISFNKRRFSVQPKPEPGNMKPAKINLYCNTYRKGRYLLQFSTSQHRFQMKMRNRVPQTEHLKEQHAEEATDMNNTEIIDNEEIIDESHLDGKGGSMYDSSLDTGSVKFVPEIRVQEPPLKYRSPPPYKSGLSYSLDDLRDPPQLGQRPSHTMAVSSMELNRPASVHGYLHDELILHDQHNNADSRSIDVDKLHPTVNIHRSSSPEPTDSASKTPIPSRHITQVTLTKDGSKGIGITIIGGETAGKLDLGIFVKTVTPNGPAHKSGEVFSGDRIIAINNKSLEGVPHNEAVQMIRYSGTEVTLLLSQNLAPKTLRKRYLGDELSNDYEDFARSYDDIYTKSTLQTNLNAQLSKSLDNLSKQAPKKPARKRKTQEIEEVSEVLRQLSQNQNSSQTQTDHVIVESANQNLSSVNKSGEFASDDIISGNLSNHPSSRLSTVDMYEGNLRLVDPDTACDEVNTSQELKIVGELAEMPINDSSSDSDFDSAIHDVIQGISHDKKSPDKQISRESYNDSFIKSIDDIYSFVSQDNIYEVDLVKGSNGLGFSIQGGVDVHPEDPKQCIPRVKKIFVWGPASECKIIRAGDVLLRVNGQDLRGLKRNEMIEVMHILPKEVNLVMFRPDPSVLPPIERSDSVDSLEALLSSHRARLAATAFQTSQESFTESEPSIINESGRSSPMIPVVNRANVSENKMETPVTPILKRSWTEHQISSPPLEVSSRDNSGFLIRSQSEQVALGNLDTTASPPAYNLDKYLIEDKPTNHISASTMSPYGNFENLAALGSSDDYHPHDSSEPGSAWSDVEEIPKLTEDSSIGNSYLSPKIEPRNSTLLLENDDHLLDVLNLDDEDLKLNEDLTLVSEDDKDVSLTCVSPMTNVSDTPQKNKGHFMYSTVSLQEYEARNEGSSVLHDLTPLKNQIEASTDNSALNAGQSAQVLRSSPEIGVSEARKLSNGQVSLKRQDKFEIESDQDKSERTKNSESVVKDGLKSSDNIKSDSSLKPGEFEVTLLKREEGGLGFAVAGSGLTNSGCYIKDIIQEPALSDGRLQPGDKLLQVNGQDMSSMNHFEAVTLLRQTPRLVRIKAYRPTDTDSPQTSSQQSVGTDDKYGAMNSPKLSQSKKKAERVLENELGKRGSVRNMIRNLEKQQTKIDSDVENRAISSSPVQSGILKIKLNKNATEGFGFSLITSERDNVTGVYVRTIKPGGVADRDGRLNVHDRIIQVNGETVVGLNHTKVIQMLRSLEHNVKLTIGRSINNTSKSEFNPMTSTDSISNLITSANETDEDISALAGDAENFLKLNGTLNDSNISLVTPRSSHEADNLQYKSPRKIPLSIPDIITEEWLESIPLLSICEEGEEFIGECLHSLVEKVEQEEPFEEFKNLSQVRPTDESLVASMNCNKIKNRYRNVLPYDGNRVILNDKDDYINASHIHIDIEDSKLWYIMAQGPLANTVEDFWRMCWQYDVSVIAMLTLEMEAHKVKCQQYWPNSEDEPISICNGAYTIELVSYQRLQDYTIRYLRMKDRCSGEEKKLIHLNYMTWPDHGTPDTALPILQFIRLLHLLHMSGPIVVHCSAGIGRSGSLITIDTALLYMEHMKLFNIFEIVKDLRQQRHGVIQTKDQYMFCYTACMQVLLSVAG